MQVLLLHHGLCKCICMTDLRKEWGETVLLHQLLHPLGKRCHIHLLRHGSIAVLVADRTYSYACSQSTGTCWLLLLRRCGTLCVEPIPNPEAPLSQCYPLCTVLMYSALRACPVPLLSRQHKIICTFARREGSSNLRMRFTCARPTKGTAWPSSRICRSRCKASAASCGTARKVLEHGPGYTGRAHQQD